jgi:uracil-DNA glycosylase family 4
MQAGFFDLGTGDTPETIKRNSINAKQGCEACNLFKNCSSPKMEVIGKGEKKILIIGEQPSDYEDQKGKPFCGESASLLEHTLDELGIDMDRDCRLTYALSCHPTKKPTDVQISACRSKVKNEIEEYQPRVIILLGANAVKSIIGYRTTGRLSGISNTSFFGEVIPDQEYNAWLCPTYTPRQLLNKKTNKVLQRIWYNNLKKAVNLIKKEEKLPEIPYKKAILTTENLEKACNYLQYIIDNKPEYVAFDYETTGIKPDKEGHKIICASICTGKSTYAFPFFKDPIFLDLWKQIMINPDIKKIAHKIDFESNWTKVKCGYYPEPYGWDTCLAAHCIQNNKPVNLKFLTYINFGIIGYDESAHKYITSTRPGDDEKSANRKNIIHEAPLNDLLEYNAYDSFFSYKLFELQKKQLNDKQLEGFLFFLEGQQVFAKVQNQGMKLDREQLEINWKRLTKRMNITEEEIYETEEAKKWKQKKYENINFNSNKQMLELLYDICKYPIPKKGGKTDEEALNKVSTEFTKKVLEHRKYKKIRDTYLAQYNREAVNDIIRPFFNLHIVTTFRSSSDSPNFQNVPKRNKHAQKMVRSCIKASPGNRLIEWDYKGIEVCISACYHKDPAMIEYILDPSTDMHRDVACDLFFRNENTFTKDERQIAKNGFVFPEFYGSTCKIFEDQKDYKVAGEVTQNIWDMLEDSTKNHLESKGILSIVDFQKHVEKIENRFWNERFEVYKKWKYETFKEYEKKGYVELYTGFKCFGPLKFTEVTNYPIQGSAFHCLLWTLIQVNDKIKAISGRSSIIGQIHDAIVGDIHPEDEKEVDRLINYWGTEKIREHWPWIIVPLKIEKERSEVDGSWDEMKECEMEEI